MPKPVSVTLRTYQVGFGDAFLLTFGYAKGDEKHVLIDFGSTKLPEDVGKDQMRKVAEDVAKRSGGKLAAVVATHRHQDHVSGFATTGKSTGKIIAALKPDLVVQPWTEDPDLPTQAKGLRSGGGRPAFTSAAFAASLAGMESIATAAIGASTLASSALKAELKFLGEDNLSNASAVKNLMTMGKHAEYLSYGKKTKLEDLLPGVRVTVLGPPNIAQYPAVEKMRKTDAEEYWHLACRTLAKADGQKRELFPGGTKVALDRLPLEARWFVPRVRAARAEALLGLVRRMDDLLNNTSLILLFEVGDKALLFPGDAQIENWEYVLHHAPAKERTALLARLRKVALYKVGHHGSLNATPKTVWDLFDARGPAKEGRLKTVMSTLPGKHGCEKNGSEVPRTKLVAALKKDSEFHRTDGSGNLVHIDDVSLAF